MGCTYCGKEIGTLRLLRDNEFCTSKHRKLYRDRLNRVLGEALADGSAPGSVADFITLLSPRECLPHPFPDLMPLDWDAVNAPAEWHFPLHIDPVAGHRPKHIPYLAADRPATPHMADQVIEIGAQIGAEEVEIGPPVPPSMLPGAPVLPNIPYPAIAAQSSWSVRPESEPAIGSLIPAGVAPPSFTASAPRLPECLTPAPNSPLTLVIDSSPKLLAFHAADRPSAPRITDRDIPSPTPPSLQLNASALPGIPHPAMAAPANWSDGLGAIPAMGTLLPTSLASPLFSAAAQRLPACLTLDANSALTPGALIDRLAELPIQAADRPAAPRMPDREIASPILPSLQLTASALPGIPHPEMAAPANWSNGLAATPVMGTLLAARPAAPWLSSAVQRLPACLTLDSNSALALGAPIDHLAELPIQAADRPAAPRMADRATAAAIPASLPLTASALLGIPDSAMAAPANWSDALQAIPAMGMLLPAGAAAPSFSAAALRLPACLTLHSNSPLSVAFDGAAKLLPLMNAADRPAAPRMASQEIASPVPASLLLGAPALPAIPQPAMAAPLNWSDGVQAAPAMGILFPAVPEPSFSAAAPLLPAFLTLCWDSALVLGPVIDNRLQLLTFHAADRPAALRSGDREIAPSTSHLLQFTASTLPGIPYPAIAAQANWSDGLRAEPALGKMGLAAAAPPSFSTAAPRLPAFLTLEPVQAVQSQEPPKEADFIPLEYYCAAAISGPSFTQEWKWRSPVCALLPLRLKLVGEKLETPAAVKKAVVPFLAPAPAVAKKTKWEGRVIQYAAAAVLLVALTGFAVRFTAGIGIGTPDVKANDVAGSTTAVNSGGPIENIRHAIATRAKVELNDTFDRGMTDWGHTASWAPGWSRHAEGYVQPGQLALFQPSMKFTDYRMEFFGQIETKSIGWVVRAHDPQNYYAMKFTVIQSGLRPIIAMVHYPVTDGHAGKPIETPLMDVMVHNNTPYHVAVTVAGNRIITSIEGQEVDRWVEDQIPSGGVGFYSDAGERARLYWMKVSKNEDFLGKVCAYLSGSADASRVFATLLPPGWKYDKR